MSQVESQQQEFENLMERKAIQTNEENSYLWHRIFQMEHILNNIPDLEVKQGYIEDIDSQKVLRVQLVEMKDDENLPNNYRIDFYEVAEITLSDDALIYVLNGVTPGIVSLEELKTKIKEYNRLFNFQMIDGKTILVNEQYLP